MIHGLVTERFRYCYIPNLNTQVYKGVDTFIHLHFQSTHWVNNLRPLDPGGHRSRANQERQCGQKGTMDSLDCSLHLARSLCVSMCVRVIRLRALPLAPRGLSE